MQKNNRVWFLDEARGLLILLMVLHHGAYDAAYLLGWPLTFLSTGWFGVIRSCCAGGFVLICGCACRLSRSNLRRGVRCLILAAGLSFATAWLVPAQRIRFGVLHLLGCGMVLFALLQPLLDRIHPAAGAIAGFCLCFLTAKAPSGFLGIGRLLSGGLAAAEAGPPMDVPAARALSGGGRPEVVVDLPAAPACVVRGILADLPLFLVFTNLADWGILKSVLKQSNRRPMAAWKGALAFDRLFTNQAIRPHPALPIFGRAARRSHPHDGSLPSVV